MNEHCGLPLLGVLGCGRHGLKGERAGGGSLRVFSQLGGWSGHPIVGLLHLQSQTFIIMSHICREGGCTSSGSEFSSLRGLRQHQNKKHGNTTEEESSLGKARVLKRKRNEEEEEECKRQRLQSQLALEAVNHNPEPEPQRPVCVVLIFWETASELHDSGPPLRTHHRS